MRHLHKKIAPSIASDIRCEVNRILTLNNLFENGWYKVGVAADRVPSV